MVLTCSQTVALSLGAPWGSLYGKKPKTKGHEGQGPSRSSTLAPYIGSIQVLAIRLFLTII